jgi:hypothetical protein
VRKEIISTPGLQAAGGASARGEKALNFILRAQDVAFVRSLFAERVPRSPQEAEEGLRR